MIQDILTLTAVLGASGYAIFNMVKLFLPSKKHHQGHHCGGCSTSAGCGLKNLPSARPLPFNPNELYPF